MDRLTIKVEGKHLPRYATEGASGADLFADLTEDMVIKAGDWGLVPTGIKIQIPEGYEGQVRPRSGLALKYGVGLLNSPGTIDSDYRGEIKIVLFNFSPVDFVIHNGDRIAQLVITSVRRADFIRADIDHTGRGEGGFGHTGIRGNGYC
ncbi:MAG TPA: dUTP diphosphatase [bacterium (Candidatus Stahlbacteria)]|nr:dUTP diphosphatase [Candidatus Stahlbacteria bacterium]